MKLKQDGYTLIEALMVVAISATLFIGAVAIFDSSRQNVDFTQAKVDIDTKIKGYVNLVSTGTFEGNTTHNCSRSASGRPILTASAGVTSGSNEKCIYLGKALQVLEGGDKIFVYDVLGIRNKYVTGIDTGESVTTIAEAMPEPAGCQSVPVAPSCPPQAGMGSFSYLFTDYYQLPSGMKTVYSRVGATRANVLKIYSSLQSGSKAVNIYSNSYQAVPGDEKSPGIKDCIEESAACTSVLGLESSGWDLCLENSDGTKQALMNIKPTSTGIVTSTSEICN